MEILDFDHVVANKVLSRANRGPCPFKARLSYPGISTNLRIQNYTFATQIPVNSSVLAYDLTLTFLKLCI